MGPPGPPLADLHGARLAWPPRTGPAGCRHYLRGDDSFLPAGACDARYPHFVDFAPAVAVAVLFALLAALHAMVARLTRKTYCWVLIVGATWEAAAFALHAAGARDQASLPLAAAHALLHRMAPVWVAAFAHMTFAREVLFYAPAASVCRVAAGRLSTALVALDVASFVLQLAGGILLLLGTAGGGNPQRDWELARAGAKVLVAGLALHQATTVAFAGLMVAFAVQMARYDAERGRGYGAGVAEPAKRGWRPLHYALCAVAFLLTVRDVFRLVELGLFLGRRGGGGASVAGPGLRSEKVAYALDALPVLLCLVVLAAVHPGRFLFGHDSEFPTLAEKRRTEKAMRELEEQKQAQFGASFGGPDWARDRGWD